MLDDIIAQYSEVEFLIADGFDEAVIGLDVNSMRLIYSIGRCTEILVDEGMSYEDATDYLWYNPITSYVGELTPIWCDDKFY